MKNVIFFLFVAILATSCNAQEANKDKDSITDHTLNKAEVPKGRWKVSKEVDENGNIIRYDSIYSWSSHGNLKDFTTTESDSIFNHMRSMMKQQFSTFSTPMMPGFAHHDSIMKRFFEDDNFSNSFNSGFPSMDDMMKQMEAMRQRFFNNQKRYIIPPESTKPKLKEQRF
ncbi:MAG: hypothetical protein HKM26_07035 [Winogradskyella sp.]|nr:hypothetical protein [Winogradskyella sp.]